MLTPHDACYVYDASYKSNNCTIFLGSIQWSRYFLLTQIELNFCVAVISSFFNASFFLYSLRICAYKPQKHLSKLVRQRNDPPTVLRNKQNSFWLRRVFEQKTVNILSWFSHSTDNSKANVPGLYMVYGFRDGPKSLRRFPEKNVFKYDQLQTTWYGFHCLLEIKSQQDLSYHKRADKKFVYRFIKFLLWVSTFLITIGVLLNKCCFEKVRHLFQRTIHGTKTIRDGMAVF